MNLKEKSRNEIGVLGERAARIYLERRGFLIVDRNVARKTGELDLIVRKGTDMRFVEVKARVCAEFPDPSSREEHYDPSANLHPAKIRKVARTAEWYVAEKDWEGNWQIDGALVWLRERDGVARVEYLSQIV
ncbi:MAG: YraN family protein [Minisyncoccia bacterium]